MTTTSCLPGIVTTKFYSLTRDPELTNETNHDKISAGLCKKFNITPDKIKFIDPKTKLTAFEA